MSLMWLDPSRLRFRFVPGYAVPENGPSTPDDAKPSTWLPTLVAAFNGGFKLSDSVGGYYYRGRTVAALRPGYASLVVHADGSLRVGAWGSDVTMSAETVAVRQNMKPLIEHGVAQTSRSDTTRTWGYANGNRPLANRSALAVLPDGSLVFVFAHDVTAQTVATTLVNLTAQEAIMLDMNKSWPTGFVYSHAGNHVAGRPINPQVVRPPSTYFQQFKKDFIAVSSA